MRIAFAHDYLMRFGGAERVLVELHRMYPDAPIFTLFCDPRVRRRYFPDADIRTSFLDRIPGLRSVYRMSLPLLPLAVESFDLRDYDVIVSSVSAFMKGIVTRAKTAHICYCHTPPRFLWEDRSAYQRMHIPRLFRVCVSPMLHGLRLWDQHAAQRVDRFIANSQYTAQRIKRYYNRDADVIPPPVDTAMHPCTDTLRRRFALPAEFFLFVGHLTWWKRPLLAVETFNRLGLPLCIVGVGPFERKLRRVAKPNVRFFGWQDDLTLRQLMHAARALIHPQVEDFGIAAVEAMAEGTPVIASRAGGVMETIREGVSGEFFDDPDPIALADAVRRLRERWMSGRPYDRERIRESVLAYSRERFEDTMRRIISAAAKEGG